MSNENALDIVYLILLKVINYLQNNMEHGMRKCVLVIDDDLDTISFISLILEQENYEVHATTDVKEGLNFFETYNPAVLILDLEMPDIHGIQVLQKLKPGIEQDFSVIILTGYGHDENIKLCYDLGIYAFLSKPVRLVELKGLIRNAMLWEEYKFTLKKHKEQLEELIQERTDKLSQEINLRKQTEHQLLQANQMKDRILNIFTLDLRSPLSNVVMNLRYLNENAQNGCNETIQTQINDIYNEAKNTWQLTENIFQWTRCQKGEIVNQPELCNLKSVLNDTLLFYSNTSKLKQVKITIEIDDYIEVYVDRRHLYTILHNLISNALKYSNPKGKINITARIEKKKVSLVIADNGVGIAENVLPQLMDITKPTTTIGTSNEKGSGLGLTICKELSKIIGADLTIESTEGEGTKIKVILPTT